MISSRLTYSTMGNLSIREGDNLIISTAGSMLENLKGNLVKVPIDISVENKLTKKASNELNAHRKIYDKTDALAVMHGHSRFAMIQSLIHKSKKEIIELGMSLGVPFADTWSCYLGGDSPCQRCDSCRYRSAAFRQLGVEDPVLKNTRQQRKHVSAPQRE